MIECDKCGGTGLVVVKAQDRVCKNCAGVGKLISDQPTPVEESAPAEEAEQVEEAEEESPSFIDRILGN